jgi:membrane protein DedA with SNARE-associated domain
LFARIRPYLPLIAAIVITVIVGALAAYYHQEIRSLGRFGLIGVFAINLVNNASVILPAPFGLISTCVFANNGGGPVFGPLFIGVAAGLGSGLGEYTGYMAGSGGNAAIPKGRVYERMHGWILKYGSAFVFLLSAIPNPLFDVGGLIAGAVKMPQLEFLAAATAGKILRNVLLAYGCAYGLISL